MADRYDNRSSEEIRRDIEGARSDLHQTVDALERKLSVGQILDEVWGRVRGDRTARSMASSFGDAVRDNPVPLALMGLGVAWLAVDRATGSGSSSTAQYGHAAGPGTYEPAAGRVGPYGGESARRASSEHEGPSALERTGSKATDAAAVVRHKVSSAAEAAKDKAREARERVRSSDEGWDGGTDPGMRERAGDAAARARHGMEHGAERARSGMEHGAARARSGFWRAMDEQPLALGAVAFGLGLAGGLSAPTTRWEDEHMGPAADSLKREAGALAEETAADAAEVTRDVAHVAKEEGKRVAGELEEASARVADEAKEAGEQRASERGMEPESMKKPARRTSARPRDRTTD